MSIFYFIIYIACDAVRVWTLFMFLQYGREMNVGVMTDTLISYTMSLQTFKTIERESLPITIDAIVVNNNIVSNWYLYGLQIITFLMYNAMVHNILFF